MNITGLVIEMPNVTIYQVCNKIQGLDILHYKDHNNDVEMEKDN